MTAANITAARRFINLATTEAKPTIAALARCLDELAITYHDTPPSMPDERADGPPRATGTYDAIGSRFPELGYYGVADPAETSGDVLVGDAIDDIMDITRDLKKYSGASNMSARKVLIGTFASSSRLIGASICVICPAICTQSSSTN
jgi:hypothetical protein